MVRYFAHLGDGLEDLLKVMSINRTISYETFDYLRKQHFINRSSDFSKTIEQSFFEPQPDGQYVMHAIMRDWLIDNLKRYDEILFNDLNNSLFSFYEIKTEERLGSQQVDSIFDTYVYNAFYHLKNQDVKKLISWTLKIYSFSEKFYRLLLWEDVFDNINKELEEDKLIVEAKEKIRFYYALSKLKGTVGKYKEAEIMAKTLLDLAKAATDDLFEGFDFNRANIYYTYASALIDNGSYEKARLYLFGEYNDNSLKKLLFQKIGQYALAESIFWEIFQNNSVVEEKYQYPFGFLENSGGNILIKQRRYEEALELYQISLKNLGSSSLENFAVANQCLGRAYSRMNLPDLAIEHLQTAVNTYNKIFKVNHPYTLATQRDLIKVQLQKKGVYTSREILQVLTKEFYSLLEENSYNTDILDIGSTMFLFQKYFDIEHNNFFIITFLINVFSFKYGHHFAMISDLLKLLKENNFENASLVDKWMSDIINVNDYSIRLNDFSAEVLSEEEVYETLKKLKKVISLPKNYDQFSVEKYKLPFFKTFFLLVVKMIDADYSLYILTDNTEIYFLNGSNLPLLRIAEKDFNFGTENNKQYIKFFFDSVYGRHGSFTILEDENELQWSCANDLSQDEYEMIKGKIFPLNEIALNETSANYKTHSLYFKYCLYSSEITVENTGVIKSNNEKVLLQNLNLTYDFHLPSTDGFQPLLGHLNKQVTLIGNEFSIDKNIFKIISDLSQSVSKVEHLKYQPFILEELGHYEINSEEFKELNKLIVQNGISSDNVQINAYNLPFSQKFKLHKLLSDSQVYLFFSNYKEAFFLDWSNKAFYSLAEVDLIFDETTAPSYIRLFFDLVKGENGRFIILEDRENFYIKSLNDVEENIQRAYKTIKPLQLISKSQNEMIFSSESILFHNNLFGSHFKVSRNGMVNLDNSRVILENVSISLKNYNEFFDQSERLLLRLQKNISILSESFSDASNPTNIVAKGYLQYYMLELRKRMEECYYY